MNENNNNNFENLKNNKKNIFFKYICIIPCILLIVIVSLPSLKKMIENNKLTRMIETLPKYEKYPLELPYHEPNFYFNYKNKLYYYAYESKKHNFYVMNLDGSNKKLITTNDELLFPSFYLVYKDEAYFYNIEGFTTEDMKYNKKINLNTGEITNLNNNYNFLPYLYNNGKIVSLGDLDHTDADTFRTYNLDTNNVEYEKTYKYEIGRQYIYDYTTGDIYGLSYKYNDDDATYIVYKNEKEVGQFTINHIIKRRNQYQGFFMYANNDVIFINDKSSLYSYDLKTQQLKRSDNINLTNYAIVMSNNPNNLYIFNKLNVTLYELNKDNLKLNELFKVEGEPIDTTGAEYTSYYKNVIYETPSKIILPINANSLKYKTNIEGLGTVNIYDKHTKKRENINNVRRTFFDYENKKVYMYIKENNTYKSKILDLK